MPTWMLGRELPITTAADSALPPCSPLSISPRETAHPMHARGNVKLHMAALHQASGIGQGVLLTRASGVWRGW